MSFLYSGSLWSSLLWHFLVVCGFVQVSCQGFLVREACVHVLVGGAVFLPLLFSLVGIYPVPLSAGYSSVSSSCCLVWGVLSVFWQFVEFSLLWCTVCGFVQVACQGFLVREACVGVLVGGAGFLLSGVQ